MSWDDYIQPASWRGIAFGIEESERGGGRRVAVHEYPFRDDVWPEDMGLAPRRFSIRGFLLGDDCYAQEDAMHAVCAQSGPGLLIHPTLGAITVSLLNFVSRISAEHGRKVELDFTFVRGATSAIFPTAITDALSAIHTAADLAEEAAAGDYSALIGSLGSNTGITSWLTTQTGISQEVLSQVGTWGAAAGSLASDAGVMTSAVAGLTGNFGRYALGGGASLLSASSTVSSVLSGVTEARGAVSGAVSAATALASLV